MSEAYLIEIEKRTSKRGHLKTWVEVGFEGNAAFKKVYDTIWVNTIANAEKSGWYSHPEQSKISVYLPSSYMHAIALREYESLMSELDACMKTPTMEKQAHSSLVVRPLLLSIFHGLSRSYSILVG